VRWPVCGWTPPPSDPIVPITAHYERRSVSRLDVHAHFLAESYGAALEAAGHGTPDGMPAIPAWDAAEHVAMMDRLGIGTALLSISSPGIHFGHDAAACALAREVNEAAREAVDRHPGRFGQLASLPLPYVDGALAEIDHVYDVLDVDGVALLTNVGGTYLGDAGLEPVFDALDRRHARVLIHPTSPVCWERTSLGRPRPMLEFLFDTTRAVVDLMLNGTVARHPNIEFIVPHAGAALPVIADRIARFSIGLRDVDPAADVFRDLRRLHYDLAGTANPRQLSTLLAVATFEHLHYGSDYPFTPEVAVSRMAGAFGAIDSPSGLTEQLTENTRRLFPRLGLAPGGRRPG
jgi:predicted TIM-barrel fold metal-dependent hydrolase